MIEIHVENAKRFFFWYEGLNGVHPVLTSMTWFLETQGTTLYGAYHRISISKQTAEELRGNRRLIFPLNTASILIVIVPSV